MVANVCVLLLGFPGAGKLTIAQSLAPLLKARIIDNHWINNPIIGLLDDDGHSVLPESVWEQTAKVREAVLQTVVTLCHPEANFIFTASATAGNNRSLATYTAIANAAASRQALFVPVRLECEEAELIRRVQSPSRRARLKSVDPTQARERFHNTAVLRSTHVNEITLDITDMSPEESAKAIWNHIRLVDSGM